MDIELILLIVVLFLTPYLIALFIIFNPPYCILDYLLYKKYRKAKEEWHYITSTNMGMNRSRWIFILIVEIIALCSGFYILININRPHDEILTFSLIFLFIAIIYDKLTPASGTVEIYKEGIAVYIKIFNTLKPFLNRYIVLPWKFFKGYKIKSKNNTKYVILVPKSRLFFSIYLIDRDGNVEKTIRNHLNPIQ
ncbi:hypothetical protein MJ_0226.1 [Methanocaldococcus jannaschii DSM 2661]|uniref:Uncharacterized protein MJ0226.1 n=1 Tax=Methanocaldococcus jannaschii (strain ATCC 43067 / DSM 2661 / JAL-1 / JCM 10045 / NBRC 100440) TaxID=243232 RepID=Y22A_METJA|nr:hypothetical protein [Methanocaldococcus jannaschii]P81304.1 RecName: Full=Uncharacterized protein MJ0226.1 [Methanocaldococcus jannaschii DSM 2661]AAB98217.1 hypothetical protein MJ_0226.1 [Methanocaldococcus jannaschii DSM 2661]